MGLKFYDFQALIKKMNGWNAVGYHWIKFDNVGAKCWNDIITQHYPIETDDDKIKKSGSTDFDIEF